MLPIYYLSMRFANVTDLADFYRTDLPEMSKLKGIIENIKLLFSLPQDRVVVQVAEGYRVYKITMLTPDVNKLPFAFFVYLPEEKRLDLYNSDNFRLPFIQWKNKKPIFKNYSLLLDKAGIDKMFTKILNNS